jgi:hypothetical protein
MSLVAAGQTQQSSTTLLPFAAASTIDRDDVQIITFHFNNKYLQSRRPVLFITRAVLCVCCSEG